MTKRGLAKIVAKKMKMPNELASKTIQAVFDEIADTMAKGEKVQILGFGTFESKEVSQRMGQNPHTGEKLLIAARRAPKFKPGKALKDKVASKEQ